MNPKTKIFYNGKQLRSANGRFSSLKATAGKVWKYTKIGAAVIAINTIVVGIAVASLTTSTVTASTNIVTVTAPSPILDRIADCESGNGTKGSATQYGKSGQVLVKPNTNGTVDMGKYQINSVWFGKATELGLNLAIESDNKAMAEWIYANKGTGDWSASAHCWNH